MTKATRIKEMVDILTKIKELEDELTSKREEYDRLYGFNEFLLLDKTLDNINKLNGRIK